MSFKDFFYFKLWWPFCLVEPNSLDNFGRGPCDEHLNENILSLSQQFRTRCSSKIFLFFTSGGQLVQWSKQLGNFSIGPYEEQLGVVILNLN